MYIFDRLILQTRIKENYLISTLLVIKLAYLLFQFNEI